MLSRQPQIYSVAQEVFKLVILLSASWVVGIITPNSILKRSLLLLCQNVQGNRRKEKPEKPVRRYFNEWNEGVEKNCIFIHLKVKKTWTADGLDMKVWEKQEPRIPRFWNEQPKVNVPLAKIGVGWDMEMLSCTYPCHSLEVEPCLSLNDL